MSSQCCLWLGQEEGEQPPNLLGCFDACLRQVEHQFDVKGNEAAGMASCGSCFFVRVFLEGALLHMEPKGQPSCYIHPILMHVVVLFGWTRSYLVTIGATRTRVDDTP